MSKYFLLLLLFANSISMSANTPLGLHRKLLDVKKIETTEVVHLNNGDFYLMCRYQNEDRTEENWLIHFIPDEENRYITEDRLDSSSHIHNNIDGMPIWWDTIEPVDSPFKEQGYADKHPIYSLLLEHYLKHKDEIPILKDETK